MDEDNILYCKTCLSFAVVNEDGIDYCEECGSTDIGEMDITEWENAYIKRYGHKYKENKQSTW